MRCLCGLQVFTFPGQPRPISNAFPWMPLSRPLLGSCYRTLKVFFLSYWKRSNCPPAHHEMELTPPRPSAQNPTSGKEPAPPPLNFVAESARDWWLDVVFSLPPKVATNFEISPLFSPRASVELLRCPFSFFSLHSPLHSPPNSNPRNTAIMKIYKVRFLSRGDFSYLRKPPSPPGLDPSPSLSVSSRKNKPPVKGELCARAQFLSLLALDLGSRTLSLSLCQVTYIGILVLHVANV